MDILEKIFGSDAKVRLMRLYMFNPSTTYDVVEAARRTGVAPRVVEREMEVLEKIGLVKARPVVREETRGRGKSAKTVKRKVRGWILDPRFTYLRPLQDFLVYMNPFRHTELIERMKRVGNIKLLVISGVFIQEWESRVDVFVVGTHLKKGALENVIHSLEMELGKELKYVALEADEFQYRLDMCDKLISDVLDFPHEKLINKLGVE